MKFKPSISRSLAKRLFPEEPERYLIHGKNIIFKPYEGLVSGVAFDNPPGEGCYVTPFFFLTSVPVGFLHLSNQIRFHWRDFTDRGLGELATHLNRCGSPVLDEGFDTYEASRKILNERVLSETLRDQQQCAYAAVELSKLDYANIFLSRILSRVDIGQREWEERVVNDARELHNAISDGVQAVADHVVRNRVSTLVACKL